MTMPAESQERGIIPETGSREQPMPVAGGTVVEPVARVTFNQMLTSRTERGIQTYGMPLTTDNGRDAVQDALEEAIDLWQYLTQIRLERDALARLSEMRRVALHGHLVTPCRSKLYGLDTMARSCGYCHTYWEQSEPEFHTLACIVAPATPFLLAQISAEVSA